MAEGSPASSHDPLLPCTGAFVTDALFRDGTRPLGVVINRKLAESGRPRVLVRWLRPQDRGTLWHAPGSLQSGLAKGQTVLHRPPSVIATSFGVGEVCDLRILGRRAQALVDFPESARRAWLPAEHLAVDRSIEQLLLHGKADSSGGAEHFRLRCLAHALELWNENTGALSHLAIDPLPHQIHLVRNILRSGNLNWLIADDVGLGKTIEVGMLLSALGQRGVFRRILIICPAGLTLQWQEELRYKFQFDDYLIYGRDFEVKETRHWKFHDHVIGSVDRFKQPEHLKSLLTAEPWDLVIFDEAHRLSRRQYGNKLEASQRFGLAARLRQRSDHFLLLSATPHQGKQDKFQALLELLRPERKHQIRTLELHPEILQDMVIRNNKADVTDANGQFIFKGKTTQTVAVPVGEETHAFDRALQDYIRRGYAAGRILGRKGNAIGFVMAIYRKLASSSIAAIEKALRRRLARLQSNSSSTNPEPIDKVPGLDSEQDDSLDLRYLGEHEERASNESREIFFAGEEKALRELIDRASRLVEKDRKLAVFLDKLVSIINSYHAGTKVVIFTEYRATQKYLHDALEKKFGAGHVALIQGGQSHSERRMAIAHFEDRAQFLISTEAGGEGINLHSKCHILVNYDLPWNPMRLVQRIGRLYRYGQKERVVVFNIHAPETIDAKIVSVMYERLQQVVTDMMTLGGEFHDGLEDDILGQMAELLELDVGQLLETASDARIIRSQERIDAALQKARKAVEHQAEVFNHVAHYNPSETQGGLVMDRRHIRLFVDHMLSYLGIEVLRRVHQDREWELRLPDDLLVISPNSHRRIRVTMDREWAIRHPGVHMLDLDSGLMRHLLSAAKKLAFGGRTTALSGLSSQYLYAAVLRWQDNHAQRIRQEFVMIQLDANGEYCINGDEASDWLAEPEIEGGGFLPNQEQRQESLKLARKLADRQLAYTSNEGLHPENRQWIGIGWTDQHRVQK